MHLKDYYSILEVESSATQQEIKKAYRRLAQACHPDKVHNDPYAATRFVEIKEAYEVLTNPAKKDYYLQQRWYEQSTGKRKKQDTITPVTVLKQALELERYVSTLDMFRMDKQGLKEYMLGLLPDTTIEKLHVFNEPETTREIISTVLRALHALPKAYSSDIVKQLHKLAGEDKTAGEQVESFARKTQRRNRREKYSLIIIIAVTVILCLLIWLAGS